MSSFIGRFWVVALIIGVTWYLVQGMGAPVELPEDVRSAPDFALESLDGSRVQLSDYRDNVVVLSLWATWCATCQQQTPGFVQVQEEYEEKGVQFIGLSVDQGGLEDVRTFVEQRQPVNYPMVNSPRVASQKYGTTRGIPRTFVIDTDGMIRYEHTGLFMTGELKPVLDAVLNENQEASL